jgi:hypothetical protein
MQYDEHVWAWRMRARFECTNEVWNYPHDFVWDSIRQRFY